MKNKKAKFKNAAILAIVLIVITAIITKVYSDMNNHFVVDVVSGSDIATVTDETGNLSITETIIPKSISNGIKEFDSEELNYEVEVKNNNSTAQGPFVYTVIDNSYSMASNNNEEITKQKANEIYNGLIANKITNSSNIKLATNNGMISSGNYIASVNSVQFNSNNDCNSGMNFAGSGINSTNNSKYTIVCFTDSTDNISDTVQNLLANPNLCIITVLVGYTSTDYLDLATLSTVPNNDRYKVYVIPKDENSDIPEELIYNPQYVYDIAGLATNNVKIENKFNNAITDYFDIEVEFDESKDGQKLTLTKDENGKITGYIWEIDRIIYGKSEKFNFTIKFKKDSKIAADHKFREICTDKEQIITYKNYNQDEEIIFNGTDETVGTDATVIKICEGYDLKIRAVSADNKEQEIKGLQVKILAENEATGEKLYEGTLTTDKNGYVTLTPNDSRSLRGDGVIKYTVTPLGAENITGYEKTDSILFTIDNNATTTLLEVDEMGAELNPEIFQNEPNRGVKINLPINTTKFTLQINAHELDKNDVTLSSCEFILIQPKINNKSELSVISGVTDENGVLELYPTVMTEDGTYEYRLEQVNAPDGYEQTTPAKLKITFKNGRIIPQDKVTYKIETLYNENVSAKLDKTSVGQSADRVIVSVGDKNLAEDPLNLQINIVDIDDSDKKLEGVKYLVSVTNTQGFVRSEVVTSDENGQINTQAFGNGTLSIRIKELSTRAGYQRDKVEKGIMVNRADKSYHSPSPEDLFGTEAFDVDWVKDSDGNKQGLQINLASEKMQEQNIIKLKLIEEQENDVPVEAIKYNLEDENGVTYGPGVTDINGEISFMIGNETQGKHAYKLILDPFSVPDDYDLTKIDPIIEMDIDFNQDGYITKNSSLVTNSQALSSKFENINDGKYLKDTFEVTTKYQLNMDNMFRFNVFLRDQDTNIPLDTAQYSMDIQYTTNVNGIDVPKTKRITRRATNTQGKVSTFIKKSDVVNIKVTEMQPKVGYALDSTMQEIVLEKNQNGTMQVTSQGPYDLSTDKNGAAVDNTDITYYHYNKARSKDDTYLDLTLIKMDQNEAYVDGVIVNIKADELLDENGAPLNLTLATGSQKRELADMTGIIEYSYDSFINGLPLSHYINVSNLPDQGSKNYVLYITEMQIDAGGNLVAKPSTQVKLELTYTVKDNKVDLWDIQTTYGNRLVKDKKWASATDDEKGIYKTNAEITLFTNYDDIGNLALDFKKQSETEKDLIGAEYDVKVVNPDNTVVKKHIKIDNSDTSDAIELKGLMVNVGSVITLTETKAPLGYSENVNSETLEVVEINELGVIKLEHRDNSYNPARLILPDIPEVEETSNGNNKSTYQITLIDYQSATFNMGINTKDANTLNYIGGYEFDVNTSLGAYGKIVSGGTAKVGGNPENQIVEYTIKPTKTPLYYKKINSNIKVRVAFDISGNVDVSETINNIQTDPNYGTLWRITNLEPNAKGNLKVEIDVEHQAPLKVKVYTVDKITKKTLNNASYKITPSIQLPATGSTDIDVGYILENGALTYTLSQQTIPTTHYKSTDVKFTLTYKDEKLEPNITVADNNSMETQPDIQKTGDTEITITVYAEPKLPFDIINKEYFEPNSPLQGANFEIIETETSEKTIGSTDSNGKLSLYNSMYKKSSEKIYTVKQTKGATGYSTVEDFYVKVEFDDNNYINSLGLVDENGNSLSQNSNRFVSVSAMNNSGTALDRVQIEVANYPEFRININNVNRVNGTTPLAGTIYNVTSEYIDQYNNTIKFTSASGINTNTDGLGIAHLDKTKSSEEVIYTIKEVSPSMGYQTFEKDIQVLVVFDNNGFVDTSKVQLLDSQLSNIAKVTPIEGDAGRFGINLELKNNPLLQFNITSKDKQDPQIKLNNVGYQIVATESETVYASSSNTQKVNITSNPMTSYSDSNGLAISYLNRTLENKEMIYKITVVKKAIGFQWLTEDLVVKVTYDAQGKMTGKPTLAVANESVDIVAFDPEKFTIDLDVLFDEIEEFGIHLIAEDTYTAESSNSKRIDGLQVNAFLTDGTVSYASDGVHDITLETGIDRDGDGVPDITHGEDYVSMGEYKKGTTETRLVRLVIKNNAPKGFYEDANGKSLGFYKGNQYFEDSRYQQVKYQWLISVTFSDEGKILKAEPITGYNMYIGTLVDNKYLEVDHTNYKLNVKMKLFPMLELNVDAIDNFYKNADGSDLKLTGQRYTISTLKRTPNPGSNYNWTEEYVQAGWIAPYGWNGLNPGTPYEAKNTLYVPAEQNRTRTFYVYEEQEPTNYQKHRPIYYTYPISELVAIINITYDENGEIIYTSSIDRSQIDQVTGQSTVLHIYENDFKEYLVADNLKEYRYTHTEHPAKTTTTVSIGYGLTTKFKVTTVDDISLDPLASIELYPFCGSTYRTTSSQIYQDQGIRFSNNIGQATWEYWGAETADSAETYIIGTGRGPDGYYMPYDLATEIGGSGNIADYYAKLDVSFGNDGRIDGVSSTAVDVWGDDNVRDITWDPTTGTINIKMQYSRKFQMKLNKIDYYDKTIKLNALFNVISNKGASKQISTAGDVNVGKVYKDTTVKYTLSEIQAPDEYYPIQGTIDYYVTFDAKGDISVDSVKSDNEYFGEVLTSQTTKQSYKTHRPDLTMNIKNKPAFCLDLRVIDEYYKSIGLKDVLLKITNDKGDQAIGNTRTDKNGYASVITSPVYPGETVTYTIEQENVVEGYYPNNTIIELQVEYNATGKIQSYTILKGNEIVNKVNATLNTRKMYLEIMNMPRYVKMGIHKYDRLKNIPIEGVHFKVTKKNMISGTTETCVEDDTTVTDANGNIYVNVDEFTKESKIIKYTIEETNIPDTYRGIENIEFKVEYGLNGQIENFTQLNYGGLVRAKSTVNVSSQGVMQTFNNQNAHMIVNIPNDNTFDIIIRNEDRNGNFAIEGSTYNVNITNGTDTLPKIVTSKTNASGATTINDITLSGDLVINISEDKVAEWFREDSNNVAVINLKKGTQEYSLDLDSTLQAGYKDDKNAETYIDSNDLTKGKRYVLNVDEKHGKIYITFYNETKSELTVVKQDYKTYETLPNTKFEITAQKILDNGQLDGDVKTITTDTNNITDSDGKLHFDLGVAPQSENWIYTFKELEAPMNQHANPIRPYDLIEDVTIIVKYDMYGRITIDDNHSGRINPVLESDNKNCRNIVAAIYNGDIPPAYTVKVIKKDADTGATINGAKIKLNITQADDGNFIAVKPKTSNSMSNGGEGETANLNLQYQKVSDDVLKKQHVPLIGRGMAYIDNIDYNGEINIQVSETETAPGYVIGNQKTSGNVKVKAQYSEPNNGVQTVHFDVTDDDGLQVSTNDNKKEITITIFNESQVTFNITDIEYAPKATKETPIPGITYDITSKDVSSGFVPTSLNVTTSATDSVGNVAEEVGKAEIGKTMLYNLHQNLVPGYINLPQDIQVEVTYDTNGNIISSKVLTNTDLVDIEEIGTFKDIHLKVRNKKPIPGYKVQLEKLAVDEGSIFEGNSDAQKDITLEGAMYKITVQQENGGKVNTTYTGVTDKFGLIDMPDYFEGTGNITITIDELQAPEGYKLNKQSKVLNLYRDPDTGNMQAVASDNEVEKYTLINTDNPSYTTGQPVRVIMQPYNKQISNKFTLDLTKYSTVDNQAINYNHAKFDVSLIQEDISGNVVYENKIGVIETNDEGQITKSNLDLPNDVGTYKLVLTETQEPEGYVKKTEPIVVELTLGLDSDESIIIIDAKILAKDENGNDIQIKTGDTPTKQNPLSIKYSKQMLKLRVGNDMIPKYKVQVEKHVTDFDENLIPEDRLLAGAKYNIIVQEGDKKTEFIATSGVEGLIDVPEYIFSGDGEITVTIKEIEAPDGYEVDDTEYNVTVYRDEKTGDFDLVKSQNYQSQNSNIEYEIINTDTPGYVKGTPVIIRLKPNDVQQKNKFTIEINKSDKETNELISEAAEFDAKLVKEDNDGNRVFEQDLGLISTTKGIATITGLDIPEELGDYKLLLTETQAPKGYRKLATPIEINVEIKQDSNGNRYLSNVKSKNKYTKVKSKKQLLFVNIANTANPDKPEGPGGLVEAGIFKLKVEKYSTTTGEPIKNNHAKFEATLMQEDQYGNLIYEDYIGEIETDDDGFIKETYINVPKNVGNYKLVLMETEAPEKYLMIKDPIVIELKIELDQNARTFISSATYTSTEEIPFSAELDADLLKLKIGNNIIPGYKVQVEKHTLDTDEDLEAYDRLLAGATYRVTVTEEDEGTDDVTFIETSDENGLIDIPGLVFNGFGYVTVTIEELSAPDGYALDGSKKIVRAYRDRKTGNFDPGRSGGSGGTGVNFTEINTDSPEYVKGEPVILRLEPVDKQEYDKFTLKINKYDKLSKNMIKDQAVFDAKIIREDVHGNILYEQKLGVLYTINGIGDLKNLSIPAEIGDYKLVLTEIQAPKDYRKLADPVVIEFSVKNDAGGHPIISYARTDDKNTIVSYKTQLIQANIANIGIDDLDEDEYSLDITKVDSQKMTEEGKRMPIGDMALFKVWIPDEYNTAVYTETSQTKAGPGKLDYCYVEQDKNYAIRLTHMKQPTGEGIVEYTFREILPPEGYEKIPKDLKLTIEFAKDEEGKLYFKNMKSSDTRYLVINTPMPAKIDESLSIDILNYESNDDEDLYLKSKEYIVGDKPAGWQKGIETQYITGDEFIWRVDPRTTVTDFINNLDTNADKIKIERTGGTEPAINEYVGTNMKLTLTKGTNQKIELFIVVIGDISENGQVQTDDLSTIRQYIFKRVNLSKIEKLALYHSIEDVSGEFKPSGNFELSVTDVSGESNLVRKYYLEDLGL